MAATSPRVKKYTDSKSGLPYFYDQVTGTTSWSPPAPPRSEEIQMGGIERSRASGSLEDGPLYHTESTDAYGASRASLEQPPSLDKPSRAAKRKKLLTTVGKNVVANIGNIAVIITIAILANQIRQDLNSQQAEVAELRGQTATLQGILVQSLNTTEKISVQSTILQGKITLFENLFADSRQAELQTLLNDLRAVNTSLSDQLNHGTFTLGSGLAAIAANLTAALSSIENAANATLSSLQTFNNSAVGQQTTILQGTQAAALVSTNVSVRMGTLETAMANVTKAFALPRHVAIIPPAYITLGNQEFTDLPAFNITLTLDRSAVVTGYAVVPTSLQIYPDSGFCENKIRMTDPFGSSSDVWLNGNWGPGVYTGTNTLHLAKQFPPGTHRISVQFYTHLSGTLCAMTLCPASSSGCLMSLAIDYLQ